MWLGSNRSSGITAGSKPPANSSAAAALFGFVLL
jgi:hypothetical protein